MQRLFVVGATGLLGAKLMELADGRYEASGSYNKHGEEAKGLVPLDVAKRTDVFKAMERAKPDLVIDTHALHNVDYCELHPEEAWLVNVEGTKNVAEASKRAGAKYVFISTDYVFDGKRSEYTEKDKPHPLSYYAKTKLAAEYVLDALDVNHIVARTAVLYGKGGAGKLNFVLWLIGMLREKKQVEIVTDQHNNPTLVDNLAEAILKLAEADATGLFHIAGRDCISRYEFSLKIAEAFGYDKKLVKPIITAQLNQVARRPEKIKLNTGKVERVAKMEMLGVDEGLARLKKQLG